MKKEVALGLIFLVAGLFLTPFWPLHSVEPTFEPGHPSATNPMSIPFRVRNASSVFDIDDLRISCSLVGITTSLDQTFSGFSIAIAKPSYLGPLSSDFYVCPFERIIGLPAEAKISAAKIRFSYSYIPWLRSKNAPTIGYSSIFTLDTRSSPFRWIEGVGLP